jgi:hypothetical protein
VDPNEMETVFTACIFQDGEISNRDFKVKRSLASRRTKSKSSMSMTLPKGTMLYTKTSKAITPNTDLSTVPFFKYLHGDRGHTSVVSSWMTKRSIVLDVRDCRIHTSSDGVSGDGFLLAGCRPFDEYVIFEDARSVVRKM